MNIPMFNSYVEGYREHLFDLQCLAVINGYWSGYYQSKRPKSLKSVLTKMEKDHKAEKHKAKHANEPKPEVDVDAFLEQEARFKRLMAQQNRK